MLIGVSSPIQLMCILAPPKPTLLSPELYCDDLLENGRPVVINWMVRLHTCMYMYVIIHNVTHNYIYNCVHVIVHDSLTCNSST